MRVMVFADQKITQQKTKATKQKTPLLPLCSSVEEFGFCKVVIPSKWTNGGPFFPGERTS
jgi:hypothetical protein